MPKATKGRQHLRRAAATARPDARDRRCPCQWAPQEEPPPPSPRVDRGPFGAVANPMRAGRRRFLARPLSGILAGDESRDVFPPQGAGGRAAPLSPSPHKDRQPPSTPRDDPDTNPLSMILGEDHQPQPAGKRRTAKQGVPPARETRLSPSILPGRSMPPPLQQGLTPLEKIAPGSTRSSWAGARALG